MMVRISNSGRVGTLVIVAGANINQVVDLSLHIQTLVICNTVKSETALATKASSGTKNTKFVRKLVKDNMVMFT